MLAGNGRHTSKPTRLEQHLKISRTAIVRREPRSEQHTGVLRTDDVIHGPRPSTSVGVFSWTKDRILSFPIIQLTNYDVPLVLWSIIDIGDNTLSADEVEISAKDYPDGVSEHF